MWRQNWFWEKIYFAVFTGFTASIMHILRPNEDLKGLAYVEQLENEARDSVVGRPTDQEPMTGSKKPGFSDIELERFEEVKRPYTTVQ